MESEYIICKNLRYIHDQTKAIKLTWRPAITEAGTNYDAKLWVLFSQFWAEIAENGLLNVTNCGWLIDLSVKIMLL